MPYIPLILAGISLLIWVVLTFFWGEFWQVRTFDGDLGVEAEPQGWPTVLAVVPARNEAETIARCVESLIRQEYGGDLQVVVVDDHSEDGTGALARGAAEGAGAEERLTVIQAAALQSGWTGKLWALEQGVEKAAACPPEYFWFTDADIVHAPDTLRGVVARAEGQQLDLVSLMVLLQAKTLPERLLIPAFLYFFLTLYPPKWIAQNNAKTAGAAGGCILLRRNALERIGGIGAICGEVIDDCALARAVKRCGGKIWMGLTRKSVSLRSYTTSGEIRDLIARTAFTQLHYSTLVLVGTLVGLLVAYLVPLVLTFHPQAMVWRLALVAWALMTVTYLPTVRFYGLSAVWASLLPLAAGFYAYATCVSALRYWMGRGGQWKGRAQATR